MDAEDDFDYFVGTAAEGGANFGFHKEDVQK